MKTRDIALTAVFAALYYTMSIFIAPIGFLEIQCRVSDALYALLSLYGLPLVLGTTIGQFAFNLSSPIGVLDLLSPFVLLAPKILVWKFGVKFLPALVATIAVWVGFMLYITFGVPLVSIVWIGIGESIAELGLGLILYFAIKRRFFRG